MDKTICFKAEYTVQMSEKEFNKLKNEDGTYNKERLLNDAVLKRCKFFAKTISGKVKDFDTEG